MVSLLRLARQLILFFVLLSLVVAVGSAQTGLVEKVALIAVAGDGAAAPVSINTPGFA